MTKFRFALLDLRYQEIEANSFCVEDGRLEFYAGGSLIAVFAKDKWVSCELASSPLPAETKKGSKAEK